MHRKGANWGIGTAAIFAIAIFWLTSCGSADSITSMDEPGPAASTEAASEMTTPEVVTDSTQSALLADVIAYELSGEPGAYTLSVTVSSPDSGCQQYADWWEVTDEAGNLLYRRILVHSHVDEQPFSRSGGPVNLQPDQVMIVRAHMNPGGYGGQILQGTAATGLSPAPHPPDFALTLETQPPLPDGCAF